MTDFEILKKRADDIMEQIEEAEGDLELLREKNEDCIARQKAEVEGEYRYLLEGISWGHISD